MAWSHEAAQVAAARHARCHVVTVSVDDVHFLAGSKVGTRVVLKASVNRVFSKSMEAGVRVEGHNLDGSIVLLTRAYFTLVAVDTTSGASKQVLSSPGAAAIKAPADSPLPAATLQSAKSKKSILGGRSKTPVEHKHDEKLPSPSAVNKTLESKGSLVVRQVLTGNEEQQRRYAQAAGRRRVRLERLALRQSNHVAWLVRFTSSVYWLTSFGTVFT